MPFRHKAPALGALVMTVLIAGCGSSSSSTQSSTAAAGASTAPTTTASSTASQTAGGPGALSAEAQSLATGDIPDNQMFLTFKDPGAGYRISFPEGWAQRGGGDNVSFQDKNNIIHMAVSRGPALSSAAATTQLAAEQKRVPSLAYGSATTISLNGTPVIKIKYSTVSAPNPVTGKSVKLLVDRYVYAHGGRVFVLDLGTPVGVDNVDAYRKIATSVTWL